MPSHPASRARRPQKYGSLIQRQYCVIYRNYKHYTSISLALQSGTAIHDSAGWRARHAHPTGL